ncbi:MAG: lipopolysaccharide kinase InaA family protein [Myxococcota bacterium]
MSRYFVEVHEPTSLLPEGGADRERFDAAWSRLGIDAEHWHRAVRVEDGSDEPLFLKGMYVAWSPNVQHFLRRWHVRNEFRNLLALRDLGLEIPEVLAWGQERRFGLPVRSFLMQRVIREGVDFSRYIAEERDPAARLETFRAVGRAVAGLHASGWIHGDLACRNLMVRPARGDVVFVDLARVKPARPDRLDWRRRKELYRLVKSADKCGASPEEVDAMLREAAGADAAAVISATRALRAFDGRAARKWRTWIWRATGRLPRQSSVRAG